MTNEEKAEKYVDKILSDSKYPFIFNKQKVKAYIIKVYLDSLRCCKEAYNTGFTEGKPKWHDLRKNPNDLPKNREEVLLYVKLNDKWKRNNVVLIGYRDYGDCLGEYCKDWGYVEPIRSCKCDFVDGEEVIAWCELPKFEED